VKFPASAADDEKVGVVEILRDFASLDSELGRAFARTHRMHTSDASAIVEILNSERHESVLTPARLAARIGLTTGATSTLLGRLEAAGHIVRRHDHADRRVVSLHSTQAIHDSAEAYFAPIAEELDHALRNYSPEQLATVRSVVTDLRSALEQALTSAGDGMASYPQRAD
jgi:DNA-binding MarR family transcriptional regulator